MNGVGFKEYINLVSFSQKKVAVITDNDGMNIEDLKVRRGIDNGLENVQLFTEKNPILHTLEPSFIHKNIGILQQLSDILRTQQKPNDTETSLSSYMENNKTEWAYKLLTQKKILNFEVPEYMVDAINWIR